jgi:hypothetical protein
MYLNYITCIFRYGTFSAAGLVEKANNSWDGLPIYPYCTKLLDDLLPDKRIVILLRQQNKLAGCVIVKPGYSDFYSYTKQYPIHYTNAEDCERVVYGSTSGRRKEKSSRISRNYKQKIIKL